MRAHMTAVSSPIGRTSMSATAVKVAIRCARTSVVSAASTPACSSARVPTESASRPPIATGS
jgi:hypothetical protein